MDDLLTQAEVNSLLSDIDEPTPTAEEVYDEEEIVELINDIQKETYISSVQLKEIKRQLKTTINFSLEKIQIEKETLKYLEKNYEKIKRVIKKYPEYVI